MSSFIGDENKLGVLQAAAAAYTNTSTTINGTRLIQGQVDHTVQLGKRVVAHPEDMLEMKNTFKELGNGDVFQLDKCVVCARTVTHGDLGIDHILYYYEGDENRNTAKVRSIPRMWCVTCSKKRAKFLKKPYIKSRETSSWKEEFVKFANEVQENVSEQGSEESEDATPKNEKTEKAWAWIENALCNPSDQLVFEKGNYTIRLISCKPTGHCEMATGSFSFNIKVTYECKTALRDGTSVLGIGASIIRKSCTNGSNSDAVLQLGSCELNTGNSSHDPEVTEMMLKKFEVMSKLYNKKVSPLVLERLKGLQDALSN